MQATHWLRNAMLRTGMAMLLCLAALPLLRAQDNSQQTGDAVADAARKARESKKTEPKPKRVFTDDDVSTRPSPQVQQPAAGTAPNTNPTTGEPETATPDAEGKTGEPKESDEAKWRKRFKAARNKLAEAQKQLDILQRDLNKNEVQYYTDPQKAMQEQYSREGINKRKAKIDEQEAEVAKLKQSLSDLEDDLRKSGGDIGWSRE